MYIKWTITESCAFFHSVNHNAYQQETNYSYNSNIAGQTAFVKKIVYKNSQKYHGDHNERPSTPRHVRVIEGEATVIIYDQEQYDTRYPRPCGAPAKEIQGSRHQFRNDFLFGISIHGGSDMAIDPVEKIKQPNPGNAGNDMQPFKYRVN